MFHMFSKIKMDWLLGHLIHPLKKPSPLFPSALLDPAFKKVSFFFRRLKSCPGNIPKAHQPGPTWTALKRKERWESPKIVC